MVYPCSAISSLAWAWAWDWTWTWLSDLKLDFLFKAKVSHERGQTEASKLRDPAVMVRDAPVKLLCLQGTLVFSTDVKCGSGSTGNMAARYRMTC